MKCYIENVVIDTEVQTDIKTLIPDAGLRRRMSRVIKNSVSAAVECMGGIENISALDAIVTATGWGCLTDSERFLRNVIADKEQLLNPTPFIQSTFNTVGGQIALLAHHHCYNVTYVNRSHSFEDALLDVMMRLADGDSAHVLVGAFDELPPSGQRIMERMGLFREMKGGEGAVFAHLTAMPTPHSVAQIIQLDFLAASLSEHECIEKYASSADSVLMYNGYKEYGLYPTVSSRCFAEAVNLIGNGAKEVVIYNEYLEGTPTVMVVKCM